jgi:Bacterial DNA polymerase III alpha NTPase domain
MRSGPRIAESPPGVRRRSLLRESLLLGELVERRILEFEAEPLLPDRSGVTQPRLRMLAQETGERRAVALAPQHAASLRKPVTADRLDEMVPIEPAAMDDRQVIEWDEDDIEALGFMKVNVLGWACSVAVAVTVRFAVPAQLPAGPLKLGELRRRQRPAAVGILRAGG